MKRILVVLMMFSTAVFAEADTIDALDELLKPGPGVKKCKNVKLSDQQKEAIKNVKLQTKISTIKLQADVKLAKLAKNQILKDVNSTKEEAADASAALLAALVKIEEVKAAGKLEINYDVLTPEQRSKLVNCVSRPQVVTTGPRHHGRVHRHRAHRGHARPMGRPGKPMGRHHRRGGKPGHLRHHKI